MIVIPIKIRSGIVPSSSTKVVAQLEQEELVPTRVTPSSLTRLFILLLHQIETMTTNKEKGNG
jgi:hypothetical protein